MTIVWVTALTWICVAFVMLMAFSSWRSRQRIRAVERSMLLGWQDEAPCLPPVQIRLRTGDSIFVEPKVVDRMWVYEFDAPPPDLVHEIEIAAPLHCQVIPKVS